MPDLKRPLDGRPVLKIVHVDPPHPQETAWEHGVIWHGVREVVIDLGDAHWYGQGALVHQQWPLEKLAQYPAPFVTHDNGATGLLGILHPFWFTSDGAGVLVDGDRLETSFNAPLDIDPPAHRWPESPGELHERPRLASTCATDHVLRIRGDGLTIRFFTGRTARDVVEVFWRMIAISEPPPADLIGRPLWTTWAQFKNDISHDTVIEYARQIAAHGFPYSVLGIDGGWLRKAGDTHFDPAKFPDPRATLAALHALGMQVTVWTGPFFPPKSEHYQAALEQGALMKGPDGRPYLGPWWDDDRLTAYLDVTDPAALAWTMAQIRRDLVEGIGLDGIKADAGEGMFYQDPALVMAHPAAPNRANHLYIKGVAQHFPWSDVRSGWHNQAEPVLFRQWDKSSGWGFDNGLASCITQAMTLNLLGYPYSFADMIGGNKYGDQVVTAELLIRWTQAVAPMPIIQFSLAPWDYGEECAALCARYARLHQELAGRSRALIGQRTPIVRPLWWLAPEDEAALVCNDEYLIGSDLLVAPVIVEGARRRSIYLPPGRWCSYWDAAEVHSGGAWLHDYPAPLEVLPLFRRV